MTGVTGFTGSVVFTSAVTTGAGVAGVTVQSALKLAPLGVVVQVVVGAGSTTGAGGAIVQASGRVQACISDCTLALFASSCATLAVAVALGGV